MKTKKLMKKLELNKKTVADLGKPAMNGVHGGIDLSRISYCAGCATQLTCNTCAPLTCDCTGDTYDTCNAMMCGTVSPFPCR